MRVDGGAKTESGAQSQTRFEQVMSRELSRANSGRTETEASVRTAPLASSKKRAPGSERVGVDFRSAQAGKILKGMQDGARQAFGKAATLLESGAKSTLAKLDSTMKDGGALAGLRGKAGAALSQVGGAFSKLGAAASEGAKAAAAELRSGGGDTARVESGARGEAGTAPSTARAQGAATPSVAPPPAQVAATPLRADGAGASAETATPGATALAADGAAPADARVALPPPEAPNAQEAILLHGFGLMAVARRAKASGSALRCVHMLGPNAQGAEFLSITQDDAGFLTGPDIDIALTEGGTDASGYWSAGAGDGTLRGTAVALDPDENGCVLFLDGEAGVPARVTARLGDGEVLRAEIIATREMG